MSHLVAPAIVQPATAVAVLTRAAKVAQSEVERIGRCLCDILLSCNEWLGCTSVRMIVSPPVAWATLCSVSGDNFVVKHGPV